VGAHADHNQPLPAFDPITVASRIDPCSLVVLLGGDPHNASAQVGLGAFHANMGAQLLDGDSRGHLKKALEILQDVLRRHPTHSGAYHYLGMAHRTDADLQNSLEAFERAVELNPSAAGSHAHFGNTLAHMGRAAGRPGAHSLCQRLSPRDPSRSYWFQFECNALMELGRYQEAIDSCRHSTALNPGYLRGWAGLAAVYALAGKMGEARAHLDKLKTLQPNLTDEGLITRFGRHKAYPARIRDGLRLAMNLPPA